MALARSVLPTPAGPSTRIGFSILSARYATAAISGEGKYPTLSRRVAASSTPVKCTGGPGEVGGESIGFEAMPLVRCQLRQKCQAAAVLPRYRETALPGKYP